MQSQPFIHTEESSNQS